MRQKRNARDKTVSGCSLLDSSEVIITPTKTTLNPLRRLSGHRRHPHAEKDQQYAKDPIHGLL
jgi:hypothetical protein